MPGQNRLDSLAFSSTFPLPKFSLTNYPPSITIRLLHTHKRTLTRNTNSIQCIMAWTVVSSSVRFGLILVANSVRVFGSPHWFILVLLSASLTHSLAFSIQSILSVLLLLSFSFIYSYRHTHQHTILHQHQHHHTFLPMQYSHCCCCFCCWLVVVRRCWCRLIRVPNVFQASNDIFPLLLSTHSHTIGLWSKAAIWKRFLFIASQLWNRKTGKKMCLAARLVG